MSTDLSVVVPALNESADIPRLLAALDDGADLVSGWKRNRRDPLGRRLASRSSTGSPHS